jgi:hypothetical protein
VFNHGSFLLQRIGSGRTYDFNNEYRDTNSNIERKESEQQVIEFDSSLQPRSIKKWGRFQHFVIFAF